MMIRRFFLFFGLITLMTTFAAKTIKASDIVEQHYIKQLYQQIDQAEKIPYSLFEKGVKGFRKIEDKDKQILTLVDFSRPSVDERMFVVDLEQKKLLYSTHVSHGRNSGELYATSFSNVSGSNKSSLGFYLTSSTYNGRNGYSLRLNGLEKGINDKAFQRAIVVHGSTYAMPEIAKSGRLGRSLGCPAIPQNISKEVIDTIKNGSVLFIYADDEYYKNNSVMI